MNYDKIILELLSRVQSLESQMKNVELQLEDMKNNQEKENSNFTKSESIEKAIEKINEILPNCKIDKATRKEGGGIKIMQYGKSLLVKFFYSRNYQRSYIEHSWHTVELQEVVSKNIDYCIFIVLDKNGEANFMIYTVDELVKYNKSNRQTDSNTLHFYFAIKDNKISDIREGDIDVSNYWNNWNNLIHN